MSAGKKSRRSRRKAAWQIAGTVGCLIVAVVCVAILWSNPLSESDHGGSQAVDPYLTKIIQARDHLFEGSLVYTSLGESESGDELHFEATLHGSGEATPFPPFKKGPKKVFTGAVMGARLHCVGAGVTCVSNSSEKQPVLLPQDEASWSWTIDTPKAGKVVVNLTVTAYLDGTDTVLDESIPVRQEIDVHGGENPFLKFLKSAWTEILASLTALGGLGGLLTLWQQRRRPGHGGNGSTGGEGNENSGDGRNESGNTGEPDHPGPEPSGAPYR